MRIKIQTSGQSEKGYALVVSIVFSAVGLFILGGALAWTSTNAKLIERNNGYFTGVAAAEAATEKTISRISWDFYYKGEAEVALNLDSYRTNVPVWPNFSFTDPSNSAKKTGVYIEKVSSATYTNLDPRYAGLSGFASLYRIISNASEKNSQAKGVVSAVKQDIWLTSIPIFQMAVFSTGDLEINPGENMSITGRVHSNSNIFFQPNGVNLKFLSDVTAVGQILNAKKPGDPSIRDTLTASYSFGKAHDSGSDSLNLPIGTNTSSDAVHAILEVPPVGEDPTSSMGQQRYYNKADLLVLLSSSNLVVKTPENGIVLSNAQVKSFIRTNLSFYNQREQKTVKGVEFDVAGFKTFLTTNSSVKVTVDVVYIADTRTLASANQTGVRIVNGQSLPSAGLTLATPNPLYVKGDYNVTLTGAAFSYGTNNTTYTRPASLAADAITVLSSKWDDANSTGSLSSRGSSNTTVNAAFLAGNVETQTGSYSGGLENFPRFLEDWSSSTFSYNGSMVMMYKSKIATGAWMGTGSLYNIYEAPSRNWAFDLNFLLPAKQPPATPTASRTSRKQWDSIAPNKTS